ncbi:unnamed protein product [Rangifer tarandus platyrhynchus]|uniref:Uncharacterized protein n=1 Tax=Rangifer tarandus platyrhynchus TaxID=3082113 RepID=A0AC59Y8I7_RANTA
MIHLSCSLTFFLFPFIFKNCYLFIFGCTVSLVAFILHKFWLRRLSLVAASGGYSLLQCMGFSLWWLFLFQSPDSRNRGFSSCSTWTLDYGLSNRGSLALLLLSIWSLPQLQLELVSPALVDGFLTTVSSEKSLLEVYLLSNLFVL